MLEHVLGSVQAGGLMDIIGDADPRLRSGTLDLVVQAEARTRQIVSGALVKNLGNDQWSVYLLDVAQIEEIVQRHGLSTPENVLGVAEKLGLTFTAQAAGLGSLTGFVDKVAEGGSAVGESLGIGTSKAESIAERLAAGGVDPGDTSRIAAEASHMGSGGNLRALASIAEGAEALGARAHASFESLESIKKLVPPSAVPRSFDRLELER